MDIDEEIDGGPGDDIVNGGAGDDILIAIPGNVDVLSDTDGDDTLSGLFMGGCGGDTQCGQRRCELATYREGYGQR